MDNISFRYFAVFDGHGGPGKSHHITEYCTNHLHKRIGSKLSKIDLDNPELAVKAIRAAFISFDREMFVLYKQGKLNYGTTCTIILIDDIRNKIYQINLGDSRSIIFNKTQILSETKDHHPDHEAETQRVYAAGGFVRDSRIMGDLALSRAFGDFKYKSIYNKNIEYDPIDAPVSAVPDVTITDIQRPMTIIMTSDAPYEAEDFDNKALVKLFKMCLSEGPLPPVEDNPSHGILDDIASRMVKKIAPNTTDDVTIIVLSV
jgi:serine/threonine protein phosphatase PrpC